MKKIIPFACLLILFNSCAKTDVRKNTPPAPTTSTAEDDIGCIYKVETEAEFPGGNAAWRRFLQKHLTYPTSAADADIEGTVVVQFVVDKEGSLCDIKAVSGPQELQQCAIDVLKKSPKWAPSVSNGHHVTSYKKQPIVFQLEEE